MHSVYDILPIISIHEIMACATIYAISTSVSIHSPSYQNNPIISFYEYCASYYITALEHSGSLLLYTELYLSTQYALAFR